MTFGLCVNNLHDFTVFLIGPIAAHGDVYPTFLDDVDSVFLSAAGKHQFVGREDSLLKSLGNLILHAFAPVAQVKDTGLHHIQRVL